MTDLRFAATSLGPLSSTCSASATASCKFLAGRIRLITSGAQWYFVKQHWANGGCSASF